MRIPWGWEIAVPVMLNLAEVWSERPIVRPSSEEISQDEGIPNGGRWLSQALAKLVRAKLLTHQKRGQRGYRLQRSPSRINMYSVLMAGPTRSEARPSNRIFDHRVLFLDRSDQDRTRESRGRNPSAWLFDRTEDLVVEFLKRTTLAQVLAVNLDLVPRVVYTDEGKTNQHLRSIRESTHKILREFCPLIETTKSRLQVWPYRDVADAVKDGFRAWYEDLPENRRREPRYLLDRDLGSLRLSILDRVSDAG